MLSSPPVALSNVNELFCAVSKAFISGAHFRYTFFLFYLALDHAPQENVGFDRSGQLPVWFPLSYADELVKQCWTR